MSEQALATPSPCSTRWIRGTQPVVATHAGYRFGRQRYMLDERTVERIAERDGVVGLIFAQHQLTDGVRMRHPHARGVVRGDLPPHRPHARDHRIASAHGDRLRLDGFIKPTLGGLESMADMAAGAALVARYGDDDAAAICSDNALRMLRTLWRARG